VRDHALGVYVAAERAEVAFDDDRVIRRLAGGVELLDEGGPELLWRQVQRLFMHRAGNEAVRVARFEPRERVERSRVGARVCFQPFLEQPDDGALRTAHGPVQEEHSSLAAVSVGGRLEYVHERGERPLEAKDGVAAVFVRVVEEPVSGHLVLANLNVFSPVRADHVVQPLEGRPGDLREGPDDVQVFLEGSLPVLFLIFDGVLPASQQFD